MSPIARGALFALASAIAFGATAPLIASFGASLGPWSTAALLYIGSALATRPTIAPESRERPIGRDALKRIAISGILGAMLAPAALAWGIAHTGALSASLVLALESVFTVAIAAVVFHEHVGTRVTIAVLLITAGAALIAAASAAGGSAAVLGIAAVALATLLWAIDNAITGTIAGADPSAIVVVKSTVGIVAAVIAAIVAREPLPAAFDGFALVLTGAIGFGVSLRWYLLAQRTFGVARTASLFAVAPFCGAAIALAFDTRPVNGTAFAIAGMVIAAGIALHLGERHTHRHRHSAQRHAHAHTHDDGHHDHAHDDVPPGPHSHDHVHEPRTHDHPHAPDEHHMHRHQHNHEHEHSEQAGQALPTSKPS